MIPALQLSSGLILAPFGSVRKTLDFQPRSHVQFAIYGLTLSDWCFLHPSWLGSVFMCR